MKWFYIKYIRKIITHLAVIHFTLAIDNNNQHIFYKYKKSKFKMCNTIVTINEIVRIGTEKTDSNHEIN